MSNDPKYTKVDSQKLTKNTKYIRQLPYVNDNGIYIPLEAYVPERCASTYKCIITKEMFVEAYNKWIKNN